MGPSRIRAPRRYAGQRRSVRILALALVCLAALFACTDASLTDPRADGGPTSFSLRPRFHLLSSSSRLAPINVARLTVLNAATNERIAGPFDIPVDPDDEQFTLPLSFELPPGASNLQIVVAVELLNVTAGVESIEWSGVTSPIAVQPGATAPTPAPIDLYQGPLGNLSVTAVSIANAPTTALEGDVFNLVAVTQGSTTVRIFWESTNPAVATVDETGIVRTLRDGQTSIIASAGTHRDTAVIAVGARVVSIRISPDTVRAQSLGDAMAYTAVALDARGAAVAGHALAWSSANDAVATNSGNGVFTAASNGTAVVRAVSLSNPAVSDVATAIVRQRVTALALDLGSLDLTALGDMHQFVANATDARTNAVTDATIVWTTSNASVATVSPTGMVTAIGAGAATITATSVDGPVATAIVNVLPIVTGLAIAPSTLRFDATGDTLRIIATATDRNGNRVPAPSVTWTSSNSAAATVDASGLVRAVARGSATIVATSGGAFAQAQVSVDPAIARITVSPATVAVQTIGATASFTAQAFDRNGNILPMTPIWTSSAPGVATVSNSGVATSVGNGTANITATVGTISGAGVLTVQQTLARLVPSEREAVLGGIGFTYTFRVTAVDAAGNSMPVPPVTWSSADPGIATVDANGSVTAVAYGTTRITVTTGAVSETMAVQVLEPTLVISPDSLSFTGVGQTATVTAQLRDAGGTMESVVVTWSSADNAVATVNAAGQVTATGVGLTQISAAYGTITASIPVRVTQVANPGYLTGRVVDAATGNGLAGAAVTFTGPSGSITVVSGSNGLFTSPALAAAIVDIAVSLDGYNTTHVNDAPVPGGTTTPVGNIPLVPTSTQSGSISGAVQDARNAGRIPGATVTLRAGLNSTSGPVVATVTTDGNGSYSFTGLAAGVYSLAASATGYASGIRPGIVLGGNAIGGQDVTLSPLGSDDDWRIVLTWGAAPSDLDSYLTGPDGDGGRFLVYYGDEGSTTSSPFASLDRDDTSAFGPETITITSILPGVYRYSVHNYSGSPALTSSNAQVEVYHGAVRVAVFNIPASGSGRFWTVFELNGSTITPINMIQSGFELGSQAGLRAADTDGVGPRRRAVNRYDVDVIEAATRASGARKPRTDEAPSRRGVIDNF